MEISLGNQVAVVTRSSRGIGAATVKLFAEAGCNVVFSYLRIARPAQFRFAASAGRRRPPYLFCF
ncbi:MAG TPA: hypothetical protein VFJ52_03845 [Terriglobia bacterium]|nr:hypothetical protein [Terriglobia bacterium]